MASNRSLDLGNLTLFDYNTIKAGSTQAETAQLITAQVVDNLQFILKSLVEEKQKQIALVEVLPEEEQIHDFEKSKLYLTLPEPTTVFPRSRKLPVERKETKWEKFAKEKGIKKRKTTGMAYDSTLKKQVARWGIKSKQNKLMDVPIMEEKQAGRDPFQDVKTEKKLRVVKNRLKQTKNAQWRQKSKQTQKKKKA